MAGLDAIPKTPRGVRTRAIVRHRWVLGFIGLVVLLPAMVVAIVFEAMGVDLLRLKDDTLDSECVIAEGLIVDVAPAGIRFGSHRYDRIRYRFEAGDGATFEGDCFAASGAGYRPGASCQVEHVAEYPDVSRVRGTRRNPLGTSWSIFVGALILPALVACLWWLHGAMRLKLLLSTGGLALATVVGRRRVRGVSPPQWRVDYEFEGTRRRTARGSHWVGARSPLGARIAEGATSIPVVFDEGALERSRLVDGSDFAT